MAVAFGRTLRALRDDGFAVLGLSIAMMCGLVVAWGIWFVAASVEVQEASSEARVEVAGAVRRIESARAGRVVSSRLVLGQRVKPGDVLLQLDDKSARAALREAQARRHGLVQEQAVLAAAVALLDRARGQGEALGRVALQEAQARGKQADAEASYAIEEAKRLLALEAKGNVGQLVSMRSSTEASTRKVQAEVVALEAGRVVLDVRQRQSEEAVEREKMRRDLAAVTGQIASLEETVERLTGEIEEHTILAPVAGTLGDVAALREGAFVGEGDEIAVIVPDGELRVVAEFPAETAIGRLAKGQRARLRFPSFPWIEHGSLDGVVTSVGSESVLGRVRAELRITQRASSSIVLRHGLAADVEVSVDRASPATLLLRSVGRGMSSPRKPAS